MSLGQVAGEMVVELAMQVGGEAIRERWGCKGCLLVIFGILGLALGLWYFIG